MKIIKRFLEWIHLKEKLHNHTHKPPLFKDGEIWWCSVGENIGSEINGKSELFTRPVLVFKKLSKNTFAGFPTSSQDRKGTWYVPIMLHGTQSVVILSQIRVLDYKRLYSKMGQLSAHDFKRVQQGFKDLFINRK